MDLCEHNEREVHGERHPWERARLAFFEQVIRQEVDSHPACILDIGAGDAWFLDQLVRRLPATRGVAADINYTEGDIASLGRTRSVKLVRDAPSVGADIVLLLDVIEHAEDDVALLRAALGHVNSGGRLIVSVPAWPRLFSAHDQHLGHHRRYTPESLSRVIGAAGGRSILRGGLFPALLIPRAMQVIAERRRSKAVKRPADLGQWNRGPLLTRLITTALIGEGRVAMWAARREFLLPGLSTWAVVEVR